MHALLMLKMIRGYVQVENLKNIFEKKNEGKLGTLFTIMI